MFWPPCFYVGGGGLHGPNPINVFRGDKKTQKQSRSVYPAMNYDPDVHFLLCCRYIYEHTMERVGTEYTCTVNLVSERKRIWILSGRRKRRFGLWINN